MKILVCKVCGINWKLVNTVAGTYQTWVQECKCKAGSAIAVDVPDGLRSVTANG
jgi:hypothetical protein